ncbi:MAG: aldose 1-epimerase family protein [Planctomycetota bacterium]
MKFDLYDTSMADPSRLQGGTSHLGWELETAQHGKSAGVQILSLNCGGKTIQILPTRGMGIWRAFHNGKSFLWNSPIDGPVHPMWVPIAEPSGLGWLDGFDEMMVRCGLASNGAPEFDSSGNLIWPLHGRIANLPASQLEIEIDESNGQIVAKAHVNEFRFHIQKLQLQTEIRLSLTDDYIKVTDRVVNLSQRPAQFQLLYHCNFGNPMLGPGSKLYAPIRKLVPRNHHSASAVSTWDAFLPPDSKFEEQVFFTELAADQNNETLAVLTSNDQASAVSVAYQTESLPCFTIWKNTVSEADGYVTGLEPATNFPNPRSFEVSHGRMVSLQCGESKKFELCIGMHVSPDSIAAAVQKVNDIKVVDPEVHNQPDDLWCSN